MFLSFLAIVTKGTADVGGAGVVFDRNYMSGRVQLFVTDPDMRVRHTVWSVVIGTVFNALAVAGVNQTQVQRYLTLETRPKAAR